RGGADDVRFAARGRARRRALPDRLTGACRAPRARPPRTRRGHRAAAGRARRPEPSLRAPGARPPVSALPLPALAPPFWAWRFSPAAATSCWMLAAGLVALALSGPVAYSNTPGDLVLSDATGAGAKTLFH